MRSVLSLICSIALLLMGVEALVHGLAALGKAMGTFGPDSNPAAALGFYFRVVVWKGLLPQLVLAFLLWSFARRIIASSGAAVSLRRSTAELALASLAAFSVVAPLLLAVELPGWPALVMKTPGTVVWNAVSMTAATTLCLAAPLRFTLLHDRGAGGAITSTASGLSECEAAAGGEAPAAKPQLVRS